MEVEMEAKAAVARETEEVKVVEETGGVEAEMPEVVGAMVVMVPAVMTVGDLAGDWDELAEGEKGEAGREPVVAMACLNQLKNLT